jgi:crossover junction endodeoxyribonuclease RuvC
MPKKEQKKVSKVVGLDLSLTSTGVVVLDETAKVLEQYVVKSSPVGPLQIDEAKRLSTITDKILEGVPSDASLVVIEGITFMMSKTTALVQLAAINYIIRIGLWKRDIPFVIVSPPSLKKFVTGKGVAQKDIMMLETYKRWGVSLTDNNICDAYGLARAGLAILDIDDKLVKEQREVVTLLKKQTPWLGSLDKNFLEG